MTRARLLLPAVALLAAAVFASNPARAVAVACAAVLETPEGVVSVRAGPGQIHRRIFRLRSGQMVSVDSRPGDPAGRWTHADAVMAGAADGRMRDVATFDGWVYTRYLDIYECR